MNNKFGERLRQLREDKGIKQVDLARELNLTSQALSQYERSSRMPDPTTLISLADYFSVTTDYLLGVSDVKTFEEYKFIQNASNLGSRLSKVNTDTRKAIVSMVDFTYLLANSHLEEDSSTSNDNVLELYRDIYTLIYKFNINFKHMDRNKLVHTNFYDYTEYKNEFSNILDKLFRIYFEDSITKYEEEQRNKKTQLLYNFIKYYKNDNKENTDKNIYTYDDYEDFILRDHDDKIKYDYKEYKFDLNNKFDLDGKFEEILKSTIYDKLSKLLENTSDDEKIKLIDALSDNF